MTPSQTGCWKDAQQGCTGLAGSGHVSRPAGLRTLRERMGHVDSADSLLPVPSFQLDWQRLSFLICGEYVELGFQVEARKHGISALEIMMFDLLL